LFSFIIDPSKTPTGFFVQEGQKYRQILKDWASLEARRLLLKTNAHAPDASPPDKSNESLELRNISAERKTPLGKLEAEVEKLRKVDKMQRT
jgi:hypothetical protein